MKLWNIKRRLDNKRLGQGGKGVSPVAAEPIGLQPGETSGADLVVVPNTLQYDVDAAGRENRKPDDGLLRMHQVPWLAIR